MTLRLDDTPLVRALRLELDAGEAEAIACAVQVRAEFSSQRANSSCSNCTWHLPESVGVSGFHAIDDVISLVEAGFRGMTNWNLSMAPLRTAGPG